MKNQNPMQSDVTVAVTVAEGDDFATAIHQRVRGKSDVDQRIATAQEALELAGFAEKTVDESLLTIIAGVPANGPSGTLSVVTARWVIHAIEDAGYKIKKG